MFTLSEFLKDIAGLVQKYEQKYTPDEVYGVLGNFINISSFSEEESGTNLPFIDNKVTVSELDSLVNELSEDDNKKGDNYDKAKRIFKREIRNIASGYSDPEKLSIWWAQEDVPYETILSIMGRVREKGCPIIGFIEPYPGKNLESSITGNIDVESNDTKRLIEQYDDSIHCLHGVKIGCSRYSNCYGVRGMIIELNLELNLESQKKAHKLLNHMLEFGRDFDIDII